MKSAVQLFLGLIALPLFWALLTLPVLKFYARSIPVARLSVIAFWAFFRVMLAMFAIYIAWIWGLGKTANSLPQLVSAIVICFAGTLISWSLKKDGYSKPFPGIGARAIVSLLILMWLLVGIAWLSGAFR